MIVQVLICASAIIGGLKSGEEQYCSVNKKGEAIVATRPSKTKNEITMHSTWEVPKNCTVNWTKQGSLEVIDVNCNNGERYILPSSQCGISIMDNGEK